MSEKLKHAIEKNFKNHKNLKMKCLLNDVCFSFPSQPSASTNVLDHSTDACGKQALQEIRELPDCTAIISISGSSRVMTESSQKQLTNTKSPSHRKSLERLQWALQTQSHACAHRRTWELSPLLWEDTNSPPFRQVKMAQSWVTADRKPSDPEKTWSSWLEQWLLPSCPL